MLPRCERCQGLSEKCVYPERAKRRPRVIVSRQNGLQNQPSPPSSSSLSSILDQLKGVEEYCVQLRQQMQPSSSTTQTQDSSPASLGASSTSQLSSCFVTSRPPSRSEVRSTQLSCSPAPTLDLSASPQVVCPEEQNIPTVSYHLTTGSNIPIYVLEKLEALYNSVRQTRKRALQSYLDIRAISQELKIPKEFAKVWVEGWWTHPSSCSCIS